MVNCTTNVKFSDEKSRMSFYRKLKVETAVKKIMKKAVLHKKLIFKNIVLKN